MKRAGLVGFIVVGLAAVAGAGVVGAVGVDGPEGRSAGSAGMPFALERVADAYEGTAREVLQARGYTYVAVALADGEVRWTASLSKPVAPGARVRVRSFGAARDFESRQLARTFPELRFGVITVVSPLTDPGPAVPHERQST